MIDKVFKILLSAKKQTPQLHNFMIGTFIMGPNKYIKRVKINNLAIQKHNYATY